MRKGRDRCGVHCARGIVVPTVILAHMPCIILHAVHAMSALSLRAGNQHHHIVIQLCAVGVQHSCTYLHCNVLDRGCRSGLSVDSQCGPVCKERQRECGVWGMSSNAHQVSARPQIAAPGDGGDMIERSLASDVYVESMSSAMHSSHMKARRYPRR